MCQYLSNILHEFATRTQLKPRLVRIEMNTSQTQCGTADGSTSHFSWTGWSSLYFRGSGISGFCSWEPNTTGGVRQTANKPIRYNSRNSWIYQLMAMSSQTLVPGFTRIISDTPTTLISICRITHFLVQRTTSTDHVCFPVSRAIQNYFWIECW